ncbi:energy transducer TonB [Pseudoalteromonas ruthenica]|uniref:energy transducer TonB n=1 Tax=Pseudoalteromonas ruthenica TaxID=151081 RepID=UPI00110A9435|nr:energy transducer TonB [Pseudoalteromonas ruthenica]TMO49879.1 energy transducer TonB [Pseudoalteromonas ruthenica]TMO50557.1 energy transducer TonB [Pseudoalteromonas ruthenica]
MRKTVTLSIFSFFLVSCVSTTPPTSPKEQIQYIDLTSDDKKELVNEYWVVEKRQDPKYPVGAAKEGLSGCVELVVGIKENGKAGGYKVKKSYPEGVFEKHAAAALNNWQWSASDKNTDKAPVLTTIKLDFMVSNSKNKAEAQKQCGFPHKQ